MSWLTDPDEEWQRPDEGRLGSDTPPERETEWLADRRVNKLKITALVIAGWLVVAVVVLVALLLIRNNSHSTNASPRDTVSVAAPSATPTTSIPAPAVAVPAGWVQRAADDQTDCSSHSYGQVKAFFGGTPCTSVHRYLATVVSSGRTVVIASSQVRFASSAQAAQYLQLVTSDGTGNIDDLLREGIRYSGGPTKLPVTAFASRRSAAEVFVAEAGYVTGKSSASDATLQKLANQAIASP